MLHAVAQHRLHRSHPVPLWSLIRRVYGPCVQGIAQNRTHRGHHRLDGVRQQQGVSPVRVALQAGRCRTLDGLSAGRVQATVISATLAQGEAPETPVASCLM